MISLSQVGIKFRKNWIFRNLEFQVESRESAVIIGPSGSGKSVLLKIIAGLLSPSEGKVCLGTQNLGMLFQRNALFDSFTIEENLLFPLRVRKNLTGAKAKSKVDHLLKCVHLDGCQNLYPDEISGGMQKRLGIARALIVEPEIILYDEPTAGLDPITSKSISNLIQSLRIEQGTTMITVTNHMQRAYELGEKIYLLSQGTLKLGGTPQEIKTTAHPEIRQFIYGFKQGPLTPECV